MLLMIWEKKWVSDMQTAYTEAAGRTIPDFTELGAGDVSGLTLVPGLTKWGTGGNGPLQPGKRRYVRISAK